MSKKMLFRIFELMQNRYRRCKMASMDISPEQFIHTTLYSIKHDFKNKGKYITKSRAIKMICMLADQFDYDEISRGWYRHGYYSFSLDKVMYDIGIRHTLLKTSIDQSLVNQDFHKLISKSIKELEPQFILEQNKFYDWIHYEISPSEYKEFYKFSKMFSEQLTSLKERRNVIPLKLFENISDTISNYDTTLKHVNKDHLNLFFDYSDFIEGLLIVMKRRNLTLSKLHNFLEIAVNIYDIHLYSCLPPFPETAKGNDKEGEIRHFEENADFRYDEAKVELKTLIRALEDRNLTPTLEEYDKEILHEMKTLEKKHFITNP